MCRQTRGRRGTEMNNFVLGGLFRIERREHLFRRAAGVENTK